MAESDRHPHRRRRLPRAERGHPRCRRGARSTAGTRSSASAKGWRGLVEGLFQPLGYREISGILPRGGTILGTSRTNPYKTRRRRRARARRRSASERLDALVAIGGEDTLGVAARLHAEHDFPVVGVPKTIDNDLSATDYTFGFDTAVWIATEAIDRLHTTAESHNRVMVVEVMGRHTGWIAVMSGIAGGADVILIPEQPITVEQACAELQRRHERGKDFSIVVVSEGYELTYESGERRAVTQQAETDQFGHVRLGGVGEALARDIEERTGYETRVTVLGHVQRGGTPTPRDRVLATRFGLKAADLVDERRFGRMAALHGDEIVDVAARGGDPRARRARAWSASRGRFSVSSSLKVHDFSDHIPGGLRAAGRRALCRFLIEETAAAERAKPVPRHKSSDRTPQAESCGGSAAERGSSGDAWCAARSSGPGPVNAAGSAASFRPGRRRPSRGGCDGSRRWTG